MKQIIRVATPSEIATLRPHMERAAKAAAEHEAAQRTLLIAATVCEPQTAADWNFDADALHWWRETPTTEEG